MRLVVDASVAAKWFLEERHAEAARRALQEGYELLAPDLIWAEVGNVFWKRLRRGELSMEVAQSLMEGFRRAPLGTSALRGLMAPAWAIAARYHRTVYDAVYLALAIQENCPAVTADRRLYHALSSGPLGRSLLWVEDLD